MANTLNTTLNEIALFGHECLTKERIKVDLSNDKENTAK